MALDSFIFGGNTGLTYEQLKRRRAVAAALAAQRRGYPKTVGEGLTYLGESIGDMIAERRLDAAEQGSAAYGANLRREIEGGAAAPTAGPVAPVAPARPAPPTAPPGPPPPAPVPPRPAPPAPAAAPQFGPPAGQFTQGYVEPPYDAPMPSSAAGLASGGLLDPGPIGAPGLAPAFPGEEGAVAVSDLPSSGYLPPTATAAAPPSNVPAPPTAASTAPGSVLGAPGAPVTPGPQSSVQPPASFSEDAPPNVLAQAQQVALRGGPAAVSRFMADAGYPKDGAWCGQFAAAVASSAGVQPPAGPAVASNWRNIGTPVDTPQIGDVAIARPGWALRRGSGETGQVGSHVTFVNSADPTGTFNGLGGNQGNGPVRTFNTRDFEFRRLSDAPAGQQIVGIPGEVPADGQGAIQQALGGGGGVRLAAYAPGGGAGAPIPGMGRAGAMPTSDEGVTPVDIEPMPTAQVNRFTRSDAPVVGLPPASPVPSAAPPGGLPAPVAPPTRPSLEPIPPATPQTMEPPSATPPPPPASRPMTDTQQKILRALGDPRLDPNGPDAASLKDMFGRHEAERQRQEKIDFSDYTSKRERWEKDTADFQKFRREEADRNMKQQAERIGLQKSQAETQKIERELAGKETKEIGGVLYERTPAQPGQPASAWSVSPGSPTKPENLNERQSATLKFFERATVAASQLGSTSILAGFQDTARGRVPFAGNYLVSEEYQKKRDAADAWMLSVLRDESGAVIGKEELPQHYPRYFPVPGDSEAVQANKAARRRAAQQSLYDSLGDAGKPAAERFLKEREGRKTTTPEGTTQVNPKTGQKRRVIGGHWEILDADQ